MIQLVKYVGVGALNALFTMVVFLASLRLLHLHYLIALSLAWALGVLLTYILNFVWVFQPGRALLFRGRLARYYAVNGASYVANVVLLWLLANHAHLDPFLAQWIVMPAVVLMNFFGAKLWALAPAAAAHP